MSLAILFWVFYLIVLFVGAYITYEPSKRLMYGHFAMMILVGILGWGVYGPVVK
jgi:hypothetical protein